MKVRADATGGSETSPAEKSCGEFITELPGGKSVWMAKGPAASDWQDRWSPKIRILLGDDFRQAGVSLFMYMIGREKSTSSPTIIFCSSDVKARKALRAHVHQSGILSEYPAVRLGDSSSPLARGDSGLGGHKLLLPTETPGGRYRRYGDLKKPGDGSGSGGSSGAAGSVSGGSVAVPGQPTPASPGEYASGPPGKPTPTYPGILSAVSLPVESSSSPSEVGRHGQLAIRQQPQSDLRAGFRELHPRLGSREKPFRQGHPSKDGRAVMSSSHHTLIEKPSSKLLIWDFPFDYLPDSDSFSEFDDTEEAINEKPASFHPAVARDREEILRKLLAAYDSSRIRVVPNAEHTAGGSGFGGQPDSGQTASGSTQGHLSQGDSRTSNGKHPLEDDGVVPATEPKRLKEEQQEERLLACPFHKKSPLVYSKCQKAELKEVKNVKQHLRRYHSKQILCPRCDKEFDTQTDCDNHLKNRKVCKICPLETRRSNEGIDLSQTLELARREPGAITKEQRWYAVWGIVFPGVKPPSSPYLESELVEFRAFLREHGSNIVLNHLHTSRALRGVDLNDDEMRGILDQAIDLVDSRWLDCRAGAAAGQTAETTAAQHPGEEASARNTVDLSPSPDADSEPDEDAPSASEFPTQAGVDGEVGTSSNMVGPDGQPIYSDAFSLGWPSFLRGTPNH